MDTANSSSSSNFNSKSNTPPVKAGDKVKPAHAGGIGADKRRLRGNRINSFLNSYFHIFTILAIAGLLFDGYWYVLRPKYEEITFTLKTNIDEKKADCVNKKTELANLQDVVNVYGGLNPDDLRKFDGLVPAETTREELWQEVATLVVKSGAKINMLNVSETGSASIDTDGAGENLPGAARSRTATPDQVVAPVPAPRSVSLPSGVSKTFITLGIYNVDYAGLRKILSVFENSLRILDVSNLEYDPLGHSAKFTLLTYYFSGSNQ